MKSINRKMSLQDFAITVARELKRYNIDVILKGGAVVSIYSKNKYQSNDVDFLSLANHEKIREAMVSLGFKSEGKDFYHSDSEFYVEFPGTTLVIGATSEKPEGKINSGTFTLKLLSPTQCVMDRLAAFYHWKDRQSLEQALLVAEGHPIKLEKVRRWSTAEGNLDQYEIFLEQFKRRHQSQCSIFPFKVSQECFRA